MSKYLISTISAAVLLFVFVSGVNAFPTLFVSAELDGTNLHSQSKTFYASEKSQFLVEIQNEPSSKNDIRYALYHEGSTRPLYHGLLGKGESKRVITKALEKSGYYFVKISCNGLTDGFDWLNPTCKGQAFMKRT